MSISYDDNHYTTGTSICLMVFLTFALRSLKEFRLLLMGLFFVFARGGILLSDYYFALIIKPGCAASVWRRDFRYFWRRVSFVIAINVNKIFH